MQKVVVRVVGALIFIVSPFFSSFFALLLLNSSIKRTFDFTLPLLNFSKILNIFHFQAIVTTITVPMWFSSDSSKVNDDNESDKLDDPFLLKFLEWLDFENLLAVAVKDERFKRLIDEHIIRNRFQLHHRTICITSAPKENDADQCFLINRYESAIGFLKSFGHVVTKLKIIGNSSEQNYIDTIGQLISDHCSQSLKELTLENIENYPMAAWEKKFPKLEVINFVRIQQSNGLKIHKMCPRLRKLHIVQDAQEQPHLEFLGFKFPYLENLQIDSTFLPNNPYLHRVVSLNPHLRDFHMSGYFDVKLLKFIKLHLPNLQSLGLKYNLFGDSRSVETIEFENITDFSLDIQHLTFNMGFNSRLFSFKHLNSLTLICNSFNEDLMNFMKRNKQLVILKIIPINPKYGELTELIQALPELREIHTRWIDVNQSSGVVQLMATENQIEALTLEVNESDRQSLMTTLPSSWRLVTDEKMQHRHFLTLARGKGEFLNNFTL